jgi:hypothetical protein
VGAELVPRPLLGATEQAEGAAARLNPGPAGGCGVHRPLPGVSGSRPPAAAATASFNPCGARSWRLHTRTRLWPGAARLGAHTLGGKWASGSH